MAVILDEILRLYVMWMVLSWKSAVCQNANLVANPVQVPLGGSITLTCKYIGNESESAILWLNGSNTDIFTLTPGSTIPQCDVFSTVNASYDPSRLNYTCNEGSNIYTLTISPVQARDINVKWSCTFLDPSLNTAYSQITIKLPDPPTTSTSPTPPTTTTITTTKVQEMGTTSMTMKENKTTTDNKQLPLIIGVSVGGSVFLLIVIIMIFCCWLYCCKKEEPKTKYGAELKQINHNQGSNSDTIAEDETPNPAYGMSNAPN